MRPLKIIFVTLIAGTLFAGAAAGQKKPVKKPALKKPVPAVKVVPPLEVRAAREKVEVQSENVSRFIDAYGPRADALELLDRSFATKKVSAATLAKHEANKRITIQTIRNLRDGLSTLESEFRTKAVLTKYLPDVEGITDLTSRAEDLAIAGKFVDAKNPLRDVSKKLTDLLVVLPK